MPHRILIALSITLVVICSLTLGLSAGVKTIGDPWRLSKNAKYEAYQIENIVVVLAYGQHESTGYKVALRQRPEEIYPPIFELVHTEPGGLNAQVITPYAAIGYFKLGAPPVKGLRVIDADGEHDVQVQQKLAK